MRAKWGVLVMNGSAVDEDEVGNVFVAIVEVVGERGGGGKADQRTGGDGFRGIPHVGVEKHVVGTTELLDTEIVVVDEALEEVGVGGLGAHFDAAAHAIKGHGDHGVTGLPTDGAVFGIVND